MRRYMTLALGDPLPDAGNFLLGSEAGLLCTKEGDLSFQSVVLYVCHCKLSGELRIFLVLTVVVMSCVLFC